MRKFLLFGGIIVFMPTVISSMIIMVIKADKILNGFNGHEFLIATFVLGLLAILLKAVVLPFFKKKKMETRTEKLRDEYFIQWRTKRVLEDKRLSIRPVIEAFLEKRYTKVRWNWADSTSADHITFINEKDEVVKGQLYFDENKEKITYIKCDGHPNIMGEKTQRCVPKAYLETYYSEFVMNHNKEFSDLANEAASKGSAVYNASSLKDKRERKILADILVKQSGFTTANIDGKNIILTLELGGN